MCPTVALMMMSSVECDFTTDNSHQLDAHCLPSSRLCSLFFKLFLSHSALDHISNSPFQIIKINKKGQKEELRKRAGRGGLDDGRLPSSMKGR